MPPKRSHLKSPSRSPPRKTPKEDSKPTSSTPTVPSPASLAQGSSSQQQSHQNREEQLIMECYKNFSQDSSLQQPSSPASEQWHRIYIDQIYALTRKVASLKDSVAKLTVQEKQSRDTTISLFNSCSEFHGTLNAPLKSTSIFPT